jgi:hypothetical protein
LTPVEESDILRQQMSISSTLYVRIFCTNVVSAAFFLVTCMQCVYVEKTAETTFVQKIRTYNVDEIEGWRSNRSRDECETIP